jgi:polyhydroxyalkanoate synthesis regulator phasin
MVETRRTSQNGNVKMPDILKELAKKGKASRKEIEARLEKMVGDAHLEDRLTELRGKLELLQKTGRERTEVWRGKADSFRAEALERMVELQGKVVSFLGVATRDQVEELHHELERLAKRIESGQKARPARKNTPKREGKG